MIERFFRGPGRRGWGQGDGPRSGGRGQGGGTQPGSGPGGDCVCPSCGHKVAHQAGQRCLDISCPKCGTRMVRG
jgi:hypothetical protein